MNITEALEKYMEKCPIKGYQNKYSGMLQREEKMLEDLREDEIKILCEFVTGKS